MTLYAKSYEHLHDPLTLEHGGVSLDHPYSVFTDYFGLHGMGCTVYDILADSCDSIVPGQFSFLAGFDTEPPAEPAPQRVMLHPRQLHISTSIVVVGLFFLF